jgi:hypothetical protein
LGEARTGGGDGEAQWTLETRLVKQGTRLPFLVDSIGPVSAMPAFLLFLASSISFFALALLF